MQIGIFAIHKSVFGLLSIGISTILVCQKPKNRREIATKFMKTAAIKKKRIRDAHTHTHTSTHAALFKCELKSQKLLACLIIVAQGSRWLQSKFNNNNQGKKHTTHVCLIGQIFLLPLSNN